MNTNHAFLDELIRTVHKLFHLSTPLYCFALETSSREPKRKVLHCPYVRMETTLTSEQENVREGKISTGQMPPPDAMRLDNKSTHSLASVRNTSSFELTR